MDVDFTDSSIVKSHNVRDVIFGRGHGVHSWPGNVAFRHIVWAYKDRYIYSNRSDRRGIGKDVMQEIKKLINGRFLIVNPQTGNYHEVSKKRAEDKACQCLRQKETKMPTGFNRQRMKKNHEKWFLYISRNLSIVNNHHSTTVTSEGPASIHVASEFAKSHHQAVVERSKSKVTNHISLMVTSENGKSVPASSNVAKRCHQAGVTRNKKKIMTSTVPVLTNFLGREPSFTANKDMTGNSISLSEDVSEYHGTVDIDDAINLTNGDIVNPFMPSHIESSLSDKFGHIFDDDVSILIDVKEWTEQNGVTFA